jgi:Fe-S cluster assembly iron-binding protein IscA
MCSLFPWKHGISYLFIFCHNINKRALIFEKKKTRFAVYRMAKNFKMAEKLDFQSKTQ